MDDPGLVFWHSFEPGAASSGLDGVITTLGLAAFGAEFALLEVPQRLDQAKRLLAQLRVLLVWDNFESVKEMPDPARVTPPLDGEGCAALKEFLDWVREHSRSTVLLTSRTQEEWLGPIRRVGVGGLNRAEAAEYAGHLLAPFPAAQRKRERRSFGELLEWLDGHPLAMRLTLPRLEGADPEGLLATLKGTIPLPVDELSAGRNTSLPASITYSYVHLSGEARRLLPAVSLFHGMADEGVLAVVSTSAGVPGRLAGVSREEWKEVLQEAVHVGLLTSLGVGMYRIHPALPSYLAVGWHAEDPASYAAEREACEQALCTAVAAFSVWLTRQIESGDAALAYATIGLQRQTLGAMLAHALDHQAWANADGIVRALYAYYDNRGFSGELSAWADRILETTAGLGQALPDPGRSLWLYTIVKQASMQRDQRHFDQAVQTYRRALAYLQDQPETEWTRSNVSVLYHQLGITAKDCGQLDQAEDWYRKAVAISEEFNLRSSMAAIYEDLGSLTQTRGQLDQAEDWYRKALAIKEEIGNLPLMATAYHQLGITAESRGHLEQAQDWYRKALVISEELGNRPYMAATYYQLGRIAYLGGQLDQAEDWYRKTLPTFEEFNNRLGLATVYHQFGNIFQDRRQLDEADSWYRRSLAINKELDNRPGMALTYAQLGLLAEARGQALAAMQWDIQSVTLFDQFPSLRAATGTIALVRLTRQLGINTLQATWQQVTGQPIPQTVRNYIASHQDEQPRGAL